MREPLAPINSHTEVFGAESVRQCLGNGNALSKKSIFLSQVIMTFIMASTMSGLMSLIHQGPSMEWLANWPSQFIIAWPIAFALTMVAWPASMKLAAKLLTPSRTND